VSASDSTYGRIAKNPLIRRERSSRSIALGTFTAGVHILSWQVSLLGLIMAFGVPAIAWIENSALLLVLVAAVIVGIGIVIWWHWHERRGRMV
jgi:hypothetical protein